MNSETEPKDIVHGLVESAKGKAEDQILRAYFTSVFEMSPLVDKFMEAHPWCIRLQLDKTVTPENALKRRLKRYYRQLMYTILEFIGFLIFVMIAVFSI